MRHNGQRSTQNKIFDINMDDINRQKFLSVCLIMAKTNLFVAISVFLPLIPPNVAQDALRCIHDPTCSFQRYTRDYMLVLQCTRAPGVVLLAVYRLLVVLLAVYRLLVVLLAVYRLLVVLLAVYRSLGCYLVETYEIYKPHAYKLHIHVNHV